MPEVIVRKRVAKRSGSWRFQLRRWGYHHRPMLAAIAAFVVAVCVACAMFGAAILSGATPTATADQTDEPAT